MGPRAMEDGRGDRAPGRKEGPQASDRMGRPAARLWLLDELDRVIVETQAPGEIARAALERLSQLIHCGWSSVALFDFEAERAELIAARPHGEGTRPPIPLWLPPFADGLDSLRRDELYVVEDLAAFPDATDGPEAMVPRGMRSLLMVPLRCRGELVGSLNVATDEVGGLPPEESEIAREVADQLSVALCQARLYEQLRRGEERLRLLSRRLVEGQEAERRRIARELHDEIGQSLTGLKLTLQALHRSCDGPEMKLPLQEALETVDRILRQTRDLSLSLRPSLLDDLGLVPALRWYVDRVAQQAGFVAHFAADPFETRLPPAVETACFRVAQEALTNVVRHAQARRVYVEVRRRDGELSLVVRDDGVGFDVEAALEGVAHGVSLGLLSMQERVRLIGGRLEIESVIGKGAEVRAVFPIPSPSPYEEPAR